MLAHRGWWTSPAEKNGLAALTRALEAGYGLETDVRDACGSLVISHDPPKGDEPTLRQLLEVYLSIGNRTPLALNIKADGLQAPLRALLDDLAIHEAVVFDMSVPDTLGWIRAGVPFLTRHSEVEPEPCLYAEAAGVWIDGFAGDWYDGAVITRHLDAGKTVAVVSGELHGRDPDATWRKFGEMELPASDRVWLCTDLPAEAAALAARAWRR